jgi:hypothetical protein
MVAAFRELRHDPPALALAVVSATVTVAIILARYSGVLDSPWDWRISLLWAPLVGLALFYSGLILSFVLALRRADQDS